MKNKILVLLFVAIMCTCIGLLVGCAHTCSFGEWVEIKPATCTEKGLKERVCSCGKKEEEIIPINLSNHNFEEIIGLQVTLHTNGTKDANAGEIIGRDIGATTENNVSTNVDIEYKLKENE